MKRICFLQLSAACVMMAGQAHGAVLAYEGFDYTGTAIGNLTGGTGWLAADPVPPQTVGWGDGDNDYSDALSDDATSLSSPAFPFAPQGARIKHTGAGEAVRYFTSTFDLSQEGHTVYLSFLVRKSGQPATSGESFEVDFIPMDSTSIQLTRFGLGSDEKFFLNASSNKGIDIVSGDVYYVVAKVVSHAGNDDVFMNTYGPGDSVPLTEPAAWMMSASISGTNSGKTLAGIRIESAANVVDAEVDEIRMGDTWQGVAVPEPASLALLAGVAIIAGRRRRAL